MFSDLYRSNQPLLLMKLKYALIIFAAIFTLSSCSSGQKRLEKGDYDLAVYKAVKRLGQSPDHRKASRVLKEAYTLAVDGHMRRVEYLDKSNDIGKFDKMVSEYMAIDNLNTAVRRYPKYHKLLELTDVTDELILTRQLASEAHIREAKRLLAMGTKEHARLAYYRFVDANGYVPGSVDVATMDSAQEMGTIYVAVEFNRDRNFFSGFQSDDLFYGLLNGIKDTRYTFLRVIDPSVDDLQPDELVRIEVDDAMIGGVNFSRDTREITKDNVYIGDAETDSGEVVKVYGKVTAEYIEFSKTINCRASVKIERLNAYSGELLQSNILGSSYDWVERWATYKGDKRALSQAQLDYIERSEPSIPNPMWLFNETSRPLIGQGISFFRNQYVFLR